MSLLEDVSSLNINYQEYKQEPHPAVKNAVMEYIDFGNYTIRKMTQKKKITYTFATANLHTTFYQGKDLQKLLQVIRQELSYTIVL